ncbi:uncharacterized protein LOC125823817 [Solanum verrucosum]|uniref:uncharacterized protein LOC125823817 n=1 Tax=Solanum verrucosum TaxID=315347 RepID=UPI0020CFF13F|nr:uncharacterized protein LOC125823817 [Solanum verrucosum]
MANLAGGQPPLEVVPLVHVLSNKLLTGEMSYATTLQPTMTTRAPVPIKPSSLLHGEPKVIWEEEKVCQMIVNEDLEYAVVGKFSYRWPDIQELRKIIPKQCELKGDVNIGLLCNRYVLIWASRMEDYVNLLSKPIFYIAHRNWYYPMRTFKWDPFFDPLEEMSIAVAWISLPVLPPNFFGKETIFLIAAAVGKPLQVDTATSNKTRPSCARVKVEVDLMGEFLKRVNVGIKKKSGEIVAKWVTIRYDYLPKYCKNCKLQGHNEKECFVLHPELYPKEEDVSEKEATAKEKMKKDGGQRWNHKEKAKEETNVILGNKFDALTEEEGKEESKQQQNERDTTSMNSEGKDVMSKGLGKTKKWVEEIFGAQREEGELPVKSNKIEGATIEREDSVKESMQKNDKTGEASIKIISKDTDTQEKNNMEEVKGKKEVSSKDDKSEQINVEEKPPNPPNADHTNLEGEGSSTNKTDESTNEEWELVSLRQMQEEPDKTFENRDEEKDENIMENIAEVSKDGDLSPRHIKELRTGRKINKPEDQSALKILLIVIDLNKRNKLSYIALLEPFKGPHELENYRRRLGMANAMANLSSKIWVFWNDEWVGNVLSDSHQQLSIIFKNQVLQKEICVTAVYARCNALDRLELWDELENISINSDISWIVGGDFNVVLDASEKLGGLPVTNIETVDFAHCVNVCALNEIKYTGSSYTWWNGRIEDECIFKRLDRVFGNLVFLQQFPVSEVQHLVREGLDHAPLLLQCNSNNERVSKPFRFLNFWVKHGEFLRVVRENWEMDIQGGPFYIVKEQMNRLKRVLSKWSKESYGDIFQKVSTLEDVIKVKEVQLEVHCSDENMRDLNKAEEELQKFYQLEEDFWKQKSGMKWFNDDDRNTKFFHSYVKGRRRRLIINEIEDENEAILREDKSIGEEAMKVFEDQFAAGAVSDD